MWRGELSDTLLTWLPSLTLYMVDYWRPNNSMNTNKDEIEEAKAAACAVADRHRDRAVVCAMTSLEAADYLRGVRLDFVFLDANHHYEYVRDDNAAWRRLVRTGGVIAGHDYNGHMDKRGKWGVKRAVDEAFGSDVRTERGHVWWVQL